MSELTLGLSELESSIQRHRAERHARRHRSSRLDERTLRRIRERLIRQGGTDAVDALDRLSTDERVLLAWREREL